MANCDPHSIGKEHKDIPQDQMLQLADILHLALVIIFRNTRNNLDINKTLQCLWKGSLKMKTQKFWIWRDHLTQKPFWLFFQASPALTSTHQHNLHSCPILRWMLVTARLTEGQLLSTDYKVNWIYSNRNKACEEWKLKQLTPKAIETRAFEDTSNITNLAKDKF